MNRDDLIKKIEEFRPFNEQEMVDKERTIAFIKENDNAFLRDNTLAHMTASSWIVNKERTKVLMIYHKIYDSWAWTGGHCDGDIDVLHVAIKEANEETGVDVKAVSDDILSIEVVTVDGHEKRGKYVGSHLHYNITYLLEADENAALKVREEENSGVAWFLLDDALKASTEPWFIERIYKKLNSKV